MPSRAKLASSFAGYGPVNVRLKRSSSGQSIRNVLASTPLPDSNRAASAAAATPTSTFFGSQPRSAHVPPNGCLSIMATVHPAARQGDATLLAAAPDPMTTRSKLFVIARGTRTESLPRSQRQARARAPQPAEAGTLHAGAPADRPDSPGWLHRPPMR